MNARELAITVLGLVGTFCMPWPGEPSRSLYGLELARLQAAACVGDCRRPTVHARVQRVQDPARSSGE